MLPTPRPGRVLPCASALALALTTPPVLAQELPPSGVAGWDIVYATSPGGTSQAYAINPSKGGAPLAVGASVDAVPSRWSHRRRTLGALETAIALADEQVFLTPMGDAVGNGAIHVIDLRGGVTTLLQPAGNPAGYDLAVVESLDYVFSAEDDGAGGTLLRGWSYATVGALTPLAPASLVLPGSPAAYVNRIEIDEAAQRLHVPTVAGVQIVDLAPSGAQMSLGPFVASGAAAPTTNVARAETSSGTWFVAGTCEFGVSDEPLVGGWLAWRDDGSSQAGVYGGVPSAPPKQWIPAAGCEELAVVSDGTDAYVYYLLREPAPGTFFIKPSAVGVTRLLGAAAPVTSTILMPDEVGEPFANPAVFGTRVAFESSFGPPFHLSPPGGGEKISILYSPLDPLGNGSLDGELGVPAPLGGRISTKGMDRPIWSRDGTRVMAATSHFAGAPNPGVPGLEVLTVPPDVKLDEFSAPHTVVGNPDFPNQSIIYPSAFDPRVPALATALDGLTFCGNAFHDGMASMLLAPFGELGQKQIDPVGFTQPASVVNFPAVFPPAFLDATGSTEPIPGYFGARRTSFNLQPGFGVYGLTLVMALEDRVLMQPSGYNSVAALLGTPEIAPLAFALPAGWTTTTEILSY
jgi:hypothetical protein